RYYAVPANRSSPKSPSNIPGFPTANSRSAPVRGSAVYLSSQCQRNPTSGAESHSSYATRRLTHPDFPRGPVPTVESHDHPPVTDSQSLSRRRDARKPAPPKENCSPNDLLHASLCKRLHQRRTIRRSPFLHPHLS